MGRIIRTEFFIGDKLIKEDVSSHANEKRWELVQEWIAKGNNYAYRYGTVK